MLYKGQRQLTGLSVSNPQTEETREPVRVTPEAKSCHSR